MSKDLKLPPTKTLKAFCVLMAVLQFIYIAWSLKHLVLTEAEWATILGNLVTSPTATLVWNFSSAVWAVLPRAEKAAFMHADEDGKARQLIALAKATAAEADTSLKSVKRKVDKLLSQRQHATVVAFLERLLAPPLASTTVEDPFPRFTFPNKWMKMRDDPSLEAHFEDFLHKATKLKSAMTSRAPEEARTAFEVAYTPAVRRHIVVGLNYATTAKTSAAAIWKLPTARLPFVVQRWAALAKGLAAVTPDDLFDEEDFAVFKTAAKRAKQRQFNGKQDKSPRRRLTKRNFLLRAATRAAKRVLGSLRKRPVEAKVTRDRIFACFTPLLTGEAKHCYICGVVLTFVGYSSHGRREDKDDDGHREMLASNFSPDAIVPRARGGTYAPENLGFVSRVVRDRLLGRILLLTLCSTHSRA